MTKQDNLRQNTTTIVETTTTSSSGRLESLCVREGQNLSSLEESVLRMHHGITVRPDGVLPTNAVSDSLRQRLLDMELEAFEQTGRGAELPDLPANAVHGAISEKAKHIVDKLKNN